MKPIILPILLLLCTYLIGFSQEKKKTPILHQVMDIEPISVASSKNQSPISNQKTVVKKPVTTKKRGYYKAPKKQLVKEKTPKKVNDTIYHYYINGKVSVKIYPIDAYTKKIDFFDLYSKKTFTIENYDRSFKVTTKLSFQNNGAVDKAITRSIPDAGIETGVETIVFSSTNMPVTRKISRDSYHNRRLEIPVIEYWNEKQQKWYKQETIECQPVPKEYQNSKE